VSYAALGAGFALLALVSTVAVAIPAIAAVGAGMGALISLLRSIIIDIPPETYRAGLVGITEAGSRFAFTVTPVIMGAAITAFAPMLGFEAAIRATVLVTAVLTGACGILAIFAARAASATDPAARES